MIERSLAFGAQQGLVGTVCLPEPGAGAARVGLVMFNAGVVHRVGPYRINVRLARRLARRGIPSLRFDLAGQGDSARSESTASFEQQAVADMRVALDTLAAEAGVERFALFGFCSGGVHSYASALADERVAGLLMYDTYMYPTFRSRLNRYLMPVRERGFFAIAGSRLRRLTQRFGGAAAGADAPSYSLFAHPAPEEFARNLRAFHARGTKVGLVMSGGFRNLYNYREQFRDAFAPHGVADLATCDFFPAMTHTAMDLGQQARFMDCIEEWMADLDQGLRRGAEPR